MNADDVIRRLAEEVRNTTGNRQTPLPILCDRGFFDLGIESRHLASLHGFISANFGVEMAVTDFFDYPNINKLAAYILRSNPDLTGGDRQPCS